MSKARRKDKASSQLPSLWLILIVLIGLGAIAYSNSFSAPFVFDDLLSIQKNASVRFGNFNWNILSGRALLYVTFTLNHIWTQQNVWSYHLVNLVFHLINGVLLFFVAQHVFHRALADLRLSRLYAFGAALFFVVHPLQTESVTYVSSRSELLSTLFYLVAFLVFVSRPEARIGFLLSLAIATLFVFGMSAKETVISLPVTLLLYDLLFLSKFEWRAVLSRWRFYGTFLVGAVAVAYYVATVTLRGSIGPGREGHLSVWHYFLTQLRAMVRYVYLTFFPVGLNLDYDFPPSVSLFEPKIIGSLIFLSALVVLGWLWRRSQPIFSFSIFWFFLTLAPTSSVVPILDVIFEHRMYLPMVGISLSFPVFVVLATRYLRDRISFVPNPAAVAAVLLIILTVGTFRRNYTWGDEVRLFEDVLKKSPQKARAFNSLSWAHYKKGQYPEAIAVLQKALEVIPSQRQGFAETLGQLYLKTGRYDDAIVLFKDVLALHTKPQLIALVHNNIGVAYLYKWKQLTEQRGRLAPSDYENQVRALLTPASAAFVKAVEIESTMFSAWDSYIVVSEHLGTMDALEAKTLMALETEETFNDLYAIGKIAFQRGVAKRAAGAPYEDDFKRAAEFFERAEKLNGNEKLVYFNHAYALDSSQQPGKAIEKYLQAIAVDTLFIEAHHNVALIYARQGQNGEAREHFLEVLRYDPNHLSTNMQLARIYSGQGDKPSARKRLETLIKVAPGNQDVLQLWQQLGL
jgi:tetratricopeptide (TPR) repeat protein